MTLSRHLPRTCMLLAVVITASACATAPEAGTVASTAASPAAPTATPPAEQSTPTATSSVPPTPEDVHTYLGERLIDFTSAPDGHTLAVLSATGLVIYDLDTRSLVWGTRLDGASSIAWSPGDDVLAVGHQDGSVLLLDPQTGRTLGLIEQDDRVVKTLDFSPDGSRLASAHGNIKGASANLLISDARGQDIVVFDAVPFGVLAWSPESSYIALPVYYNGALVEPVTGEYTLFAEDHTQLLSALWLESDSLLLVTRDGGIDVWEVSLGQQQLVARYPTGELISAVEAYKGYAIIALSGEPLMFWNYMTGEIFRPLGDGALAYEMALSKETGLLALDGPEDTISVWNLESNTLVYQTPPDDAHVVKLEWARGANWLVVQRIDRTVTVYNRLDQWEAITIAMDD
jgi:WD40 repeat protein